MTSCPKFDTGEFMRGFRAACARRGINPLEGATSFEVVRYQVEQRRAFRKTRRRRWWQRHNLWLESQPHHSHVEEEAIWNLFVETYDAEVMRLVRTTRRRQADKPLRQLHQRQSGKRSKQRDYGEESALQPEDAGTNVDHP